MFRAGRLGGARLGSLDFYSLVLSLLCTLASTNWVSLATFLCCQGSLVPFPPVQPPLYIVFYILHSLYSSLYSLTSKKREIN